MLDFSLCAVCLNLSLLHLPSAVSKRSGHNRYDHSEQRNESADDALLGGHLEPPFVFVAAVALWSLPLGLFEHDVVGDPQSLLDRVPRLVQPDSSEPGFDSLEG